jgi:hypothetical protein
MNIEKILKNLYIDISSLDKKTLEKINPADVIKINDIYLINVEKIIDKKTIEKFKKFEGILKFLKIKKE